MLCFVLFFLSSSSPYFMVSFINGTYLRDLEGKCPITFSPMYILCCYLAVPDLTGPSAERLVSKGTSRLLEIGSSN